MTSCARLSESKTAAPFSWALSIQSSIGSSERTASSSAWETICVNGIPALRSISTLRGDPEARTTSIGVVHTKVAELHVEADGGTLRVTAQNGTDALVLSISEVGEYVNAISVGFPAADTDAVTIEAGVSSELCRQLAQALRVLLHKQVLVYGAVRSERVLTSLAVRRAVIEWARKLQ